MLIKYYLNFKYFPMPIILSLMIMIMMMNFIKTIIISFNLKNSFPFFMMYYSIYFWINLYKIEMIFKGKNIIKLFFNMKLMMMLFIFSEILLFISLYWTFFFNKFYLNPTIYFKFPYNMFYWINSMKIPLLNTFILLNSSFFISYSYLNMLNNNFKFFLLNMNLTILMSLYFMIMQFIEIYWMNFSMIDSSLMMMFYSLLMMHFIHMFMGTILIIIMYKNKKFFTIFSLGYEMSIWYWHLIDFIWITLFIFMY